MSEMALGEYCQNIEELNVELLKRQFKDLIKVEGVQERIIAKNLEYRLALDKQYDAIVDHLEGREAK